jgi:hypothetical protein
LLVLDNNQIATVADGAFANMKALQQLSIGGNPLPAISQPASGLAVSARVAGARLDLGKDAAL